MYQDLLRADLGKLLQTGLIQGKNPRAIAKDLKKYWFSDDPRTGGGAKYCMERLMRTKLARVISMKTVDVRKQNNDTFAYCTGNGISANFSCNEIVIGGKSIAVVGYDILTSVSDSVNAVLKLKVHSNEIVPFGEFRIVS